MNKLIIAVDFDGTIVEHKYPEIGREIPFAIETLKKLQHEHHHRLILWTVRAGKELEEAIEFCRARGLEFYSHNCNFPAEELENNTSRKLGVDLFIDDRNLGGLPDWGVIYRQIVSNKAFEPIIENNNSEYGAYPNKKKKGFFRNIFRK